MNNQNLTNCPCNKEEKIFNPNCSIINKLNIPQEYQASYQELFHIFSQPELVKLIVTDRILGKTTNKVLHLLVDIALSIEKQQNPLPYYIWLRRDWNDAVSKVMGYFKKVISLFCNHYWLGEKFSEKDFDVIYRGVFYKEQQIVFFYELYNEDDNRGALLNNAREIIFDECLPNDSSKYLVQEQLSEEEMFSEMLSGVYRSDKDEPVKLCFLGNPYDRFFYGFKNWQKELEQWATWYRKENPQEFTIKEIKQCQGGDELLYLCKFAEKRKLLNKFKSIDTNVWKKRFFIPKEEMNMIDKPTKYKAVSMWFNNIICAQIPKKNLNFFYTPESEEKIPTNLPALIFTNPEYHTCSQKIKRFKRASEESFKLAKDISQKKVFFADTIARNQILDFISQHKNPYQQNQPPFAKMKQL